MRNRSLSLVVAVAAMLLFVGSASAQGVVLSRDSAWVFSGNLSATFNQVALTNWVAGGENTLGGEAAALLDLKYAKSKQLWQNTLELGYGLMKQGDKGVIKNLDRIEFASQYGYQASQAWYYSALFGVKTQFAAGCDFGLCSPSLSPVIAWCKLQARQPFFRTYFPAYSSLDVRSEPRPRRSGCFWRKSRHI